MPPSVLADHSLEKTAKGLLFSCDKDPQNLKQQLTKMDGVLKKETTFLENLQK